MAAPVASFYSSIGIRINPQDLRRIDATFKRLETRLRNLSKGVTLNISNITINEGMLARRLRASFNRAQRMDGGLRVNIDRFNVNNARLRSAVNTALYGRSGRSGAFQGIRLDRFQVAQRELNSTLRTAYTAASAIPMRISRFSIDRAALQSSMSIASAGVAARTGAAGRGNTIINNYYRSSTNAAVGGAGYRGGAFGDARNLMYAGGGAGFIARSGFGALPFLGGVYGVGALNRGNQEVFTAPLTLQGALMARGYSEQEGVEAFDWLRRQGNEIGFSYMDAAPDFTKLMANALGAGLDLSSSKEIFRGFNEYQTAMGIDPYRRKLINTAATQMLGKGTVQMEELKRQMGDSLPAALPIFAQAVAEHQGSGLTGQAAMEELYRASEAGELISAQIVPIAADIMSRMAQPKLSIMKESSIAQQARVVNELNDLLKAWSEAGGERGFANLFRGFWTNLEKLTPMVEGLGRAFESLGSSIGHGINVSTEYLVLLHNLKQAADEVSFSFAGFDGNLTLLLGTAAALSTKFGRLMIPLTGIFLILEDIAIGVHGGESYTNYLFEFFEQFGEFDRKIWGTVAALAALYLGLKTIRRVGRIFPSSKNSPTTTTSPRTSPNSSGGGTWGKVKGFGGKLLRFGGSAVGGFALASNEEEFSWGSLVLSALMGLPFGGFGGAAAGAGSYALTHQGRGLSPWLSLLSDSPSDAHLYRLSGGEGTWGSLEGYLSNEHILSPSYLESAGLSDYYKRAYKLRLPQTLWGRYEEGYGRTYDNVDGFFAMNPDAREYVNQYGSGRGFTVDDAMMRAATINNSPTMNNYITLNLEGADFGNLQSEVETSIVPTLEEVLNNAIQGMLIDTDISYGAD